MHKNLQDVALSMLDLVPVREGHTVAEALAQALQTARHVEALGFQRYWMAEHHNMAGIASSSTAVLIGYIAGSTKTIHVGSGGVMLPNHSPLVVAEAFGTLAELYPGRIELGLGRAPGTDTLCMRYLRRDKDMEGPDDYPRDVAEIRYLLGDAQPGQRIIANPGAGTKVPLWLLGSSLYSAQLAAEMGLPYAFASHFAPAMLMDALALYRAHFKPSAQLQKPHVMIGVPVVAAPTDAEAEFLASSSLQRVVQIVTGQQRGKLPAPREGVYESLTEVERAGVQRFRACAVIGNPDTVRAGLQKLADETQCDEMILVSDVYDPALRLRSLTLAAQAAHGTAQSQSATAPA